MAELWTKGAVEGAGELVAELTLWLAPYNSLLRVSLLLLSSPPFSWVPLLLAFVSLLSLVSFHLYFCSAQSK